MPFNRQHLLETEQSQFATLTQYFCSFRRLHRRCRGCHMTLIFDRLLFITNFDITITVYIILHRVSKNRIAKINVT